MGSLKIILISAMLLAAPIWLLSQIGDPTTTVADPAVCMNLRVGAHAPDRSASQATTAKPKAAELRPVGVICGRVVDSSGLPRAGARVYLGCVRRGAEGTLTGERLHRFDPVTSDADGRFIVDGLAPRGRYLLVARHGNHGVGMVRNVGVGAGTVLVEIDHSVSIRVDVCGAAGQRVLDARAALDARPFERETDAQDDDGEGIEASIIASLGLEFTETRRQLSRIHGIRAGRCSGKGFVFDALPAGDYRLRITAPGFKLHEERFTLKRFDQAHLRAVLEPASIALSGRVADETGKPIPGAYVSVWEPGVETARFAGACTDNCGHFELRGPRAVATSLLVRVTCSGFERKSVRVCSGVRLVDVTLRRTGTVSGQVRLSRSGPTRVTFEFVRNDPETTCERGGIPVRGHGHGFRFALSPGLWTMTTTAPGHFPETRFVDVSPNRETKLFSIRLRSR